MTIYTWHFYLSLGLVILCYSVPLNAQIDGGWSQWSVFMTECSKRCDGGIRKISRSCTNPTPTGGGLKCLHSDNSTRSDVEERLIMCNTEPCFIGNYTEWTLPENCTNGIKYRESMCGNTTCAEDSWQYIKQEEEMKRWNKSYCPSPCETKTEECPEYSVCVDKSTEQEPIWECGCTMGYKMSDDKKSCIRPPPTTPTPRPIPTLPAAKKTVATVMSKSASIILIVFVSITLALFLMMRIFTKDRIIQMNMEISLLLAHIFLMFPPTTYEMPLLCKFVSIAIHWCFTACYVFMLLEAVHMYYLVAFVVKKDGAFSNLGNILIGWGGSFIIILFCICFEYDNYGAPYHCWLQMDKPLVYGTFVPVIIIAIVTFTLIEAAGAANYKPLQGYDQKQRLSAQFSQRTNLIILPFVLAHWMIGMFSEYEQNLALYGTFSILNGVTGFLVFFFHCSNNQQVREKIKGFFKSMTKSK